MDTNTQAVTWRARISGACQALRTKVAGWWATADQGAMAVAAAIVAFFLAALAIGSGIGWWAEQRHAPAVEASPGLQDQIDALRLRVAALESLPPEAPSPDPAPARPSAPRAAVRPTQPAAPTAPAEAPNRWGTTDLDRAIAATPSVNLLEQAK